MKSREVPSLSRTHLKHRLQKLERPDKWYLTCGDGIIWAPPFPRALHLPGFWDEALVYYHPFAPLFSVAIVSPGGSATPLTQTARRWQPQELTSEWVTAAGLQLQERRMALPGGRFVSLWSCLGENTWSSAQLQGAHLVCYSAQPGESTTNVCRSSSEAGLQWTRTLTDRHGEKLDVRARLSTVGVDDFVHVGYAAIRSEGTADLPKWEHTPFWEAWTRQDPVGLANRISMEGVSDLGLLYVAMALSVDSLQSQEVGYSITLAPETRVNDSKPTPEALTLSDPATQWHEYYDLYPGFSCSDQYFTRYYDYRLYGLRLNSLAGECGNVRYPAVAEGIGYFHVPITYSAQCHMFETRWSRNPCAAHGSLLNFLHHQRDDGSLHGRIYTNNLKQTDFYHANWGDAVLAVCAIHEDETFVERCYGGLTRYAEWLDRTRDAGGSGMYDVANHFETGQEFMSRYQAVDPNADRAGWRGDFRLKGIDITVYAYQLKKGLETMASWLGHDADSGRWRAEAERIGSAILKSMWNEQTGMFSDVDPRTLSRTDVKAAVCFYPLLTDLLSDEVVSRMLEHLSNPDEFATPFPVPSSSVDDPSFNADATWKGKRHNCPWNGRTWPMTNSHIIEGLIRQWHFGRRQVGSIASELLSSFVRMMFFDRDPERPNCFEHYNPYTGHPSVYRGIDDYQHSWVLDLIIRGVAGLEPTTDGILIDPLPVDVNELHLTGASVRGRSVDIARSGETLEVTIDGAVHHAKVGVPMRIAHE